MILCTYFVAALPQKTKNSGYKIKLKIGTPIVNTTLFGALFGVFMGGIVMLTHIPFLRTALENDNRKIQKLDMKVRSRDLS